MKLSYRTQANAQAISRIYNKPLDKPDWFKIESSSNESDSEILIYDFIGWPFNDPIELINALSNMNNVTVRINSPGGDVFDGMAIYNALDSHKGNVTIRVDSLAASMAGTIATVGKKVQAYKNAMFMYHNAWTVEVGNQYELRDTANLLEKIDGNILDAYQKKSKKGKKELTEMMKATTWMTAQEAFDYGFVNEIIDGKSVKAEFELSMYANVPDSLISQEHGKDLSRKELEHALRNAGASRSYAKMAASVISAERRGLETETPNKEPDAAAKLEAEAKSLVEYFTVAEELKKLNAIIRR